MGLLVSPVISNIYMECFEALAIPSSPTLIKWWLRYVDDVHRATRENQVKKLQEHLNSIAPCIKFTIELPGTDRLPFLDTLTKPPPNSTESTVYRKTTHTDRYLDYNSNHLISAKLSVIHTLIHRAKQECSTPKPCKGNGLSSQSPAKQPLSNTVLSTRQTPTESQQKAKPIHSKVYRN